MRNSETPARFRPTGLPLGRPSRCRLAPSNPLKAKVDGWGRKPSQTAGTGWADGTALGSTAGKQPFQRRVNLPSETGKPQQDSNPTDCSRLAEPLLFSTFKSKGGRVKYEALASSRHWLGGRNGPEQNRAASAIPKALHSPQRHR